MIVLGLNCGSSSVKFQVIDGGARRLGRGRVEKIGGPAIVTLAAQGRPAYRGPERLQAFVIPTDEEGLIARDAAECLEPKS